MEAWKHFKQGNDMISFPIYFMLTLSTLEVCSYVFAKFAKEVFLHSSSSRTPATCINFRSHVTQLRSNALSAKLRGKSQSAKEPQRSNLANSVPRDPYCQWRFFFFLQFTWHGNVHNCTLSNHRNQENSSLAWEILSKVKDEDVYSFPPFNARKCRGTVHVCLKQPTQRCLPL